MTDSSFVPYHGMVTAPDAAPPRRWILFLHGIYGSGDNWAPFARRLTERQPLWGAVLVDLRMHGRSLTAAPPHTVSACAADLARLEGELDGEVVAVSGHSFGGKVALSYAGRRTTPLERLWVLDSNPGAQPERLEQGAASGDIAMHVLSILEQLPRHFAERAELSAFLTSHGLQKGVADWLGKNLQRDGDGYRFALDVVALRELLDDYLGQDLWSVLADPSVSEETHVILGGRSQSLPESSHRRLNELADDVSSPVRTHVIEEAGHWLHVDAPKRLLELFMEALPAS